MWTVYKYPLQITDEQRLWLPATAQILCVQFQREQLCLWAKVDTTAETLERRIFIVGTGCPCPSMAAHYIGTVQQLGGALVWHVFEGQ